MKSYVGLGIAVATFIAALFWLNWDVTESRLKVSSKLQGAPQGMSDDAALTGGNAPDLAHLTQFSDVIISGTIKSIGTQVWYEPPPTPGPTPTYDSGRPNGNHIGGYVVFYKVEVDDVVKGTGIVTATNVITLAASYPSSSSEIGVVSDEYLYFLQKYVYDDHFSMPYGSGGRLLLSSAPVRYTDDHEGPVPFATALSIAQFLEDLEDEINSQATATITPMPTSTPDPTDSEDPGNPTPTP